MNDYQEPYANHPYYPWDLYDPYDQYDVYVPSVAYVPSVPFAYQPLFWQALLAGIADVAAVVILGSQAFSMAKKALKGEEILR